jgi:hypothetical protein
MIAFLATGSEAVNGETQGPQGGSAANQTVDHRGNGKTSNMECRGKKRRIATKRRKKPRKEDVGTIELISRIQQLEISLWFFAFMVALFWGHPRPASGRIPGPMFATARSRGTRSDSTLSCVSTR